MTPDELFELPHGAYVTLNGCYYERRNVEPDSGEPEFREWEMGLLVDADDLDGAVACASLEYPGGGV